MRCAVRDSLHAERRDSYMRSSGRSNIRVSKFRKNIPANGNFFLKRIYSSRENLADEHKRRPVKRMRVFVADFEHRGLQCLSSTLLRHGAVERFHELRGATIINIP